LDPLGLQQLLVVQILLPTRLTPHLLELQIYYGILFRGEGPPFRWNVVFGSLPILDHGVFGSSHAQALVVSQGTHLIYCQTFVLIDASLVKAGIDKAGEGGSLVIVEHGPLLLVPTVREHRRNYLLSIFLFFFDVITKLFLGVRVLEDHLFVARRHHLRDILELGVVIVLLLLLQQWRRHARQR